MAKVQNKLIWETKPGSKEFRLNKVDDRATVDVGLTSKHAGKLGPGWRTELWKGRSWIEVSGHNVRIHKEGKLTKDAKRGEFYECECLRSVRGRDQAERHIVLPGSTEYQIVWDTIDDVPDDGIIELLLSFSGDLTWYKQPALTQQEIDEGHIRPDNVINSYAVYTNASGNFVRPDGTEIVSYETGKAFHLYRPQLIDSKGNTLWLDQTAPLANPNRLKIGLDMRWLADAQFPVTLDPTFGYTSLGASEYTGNYSLASLANPRSASSGDVVTGISAGLRNPLFAAYAKVAVYALSGTAPQGRLSEADVLVGTTKQFYTVSSLSWSLSGGTSYCPAMQSTLDLAYAADSGTGSNRAYKSGSSFTDPFGTATVDSYHVSVYATYEVATSVKPYYAYAQQ